MYFQDLMLKLLDYWGGSKGCTILEPYDVERELEL